MIISKIILSSTFIPLTSMAGFSGPLLYVSLINWVICNPYLIFETCIPPLLGLFNESGFHHRYTSAINNTNTY